MDRGWMCSLTYFFVRSLNKVHNIPPELISGQFLRLRIRGV